MNEKADNSIMMTLLIAMCRELQINPEILAEAYLNKGENQKYFDELHKNIMAINEVTE